MSNRAAYNFLSSISLGGNQAQKKDTTQTPATSTQTQTQPQPTPQQPQASEKPHHSHREHFKAKLSSTLEKKHLHRHDKPPNPPSSNSNPLVPSTSTPATSISNSALNVTANKPSVHPNSLKRSTSNITLSNDYNSHAVVRSTSGNAIQNREYTREPSPRDIKSSSSSNDSTGKPRNNSTEQPPPVKLRDSGDYGIVRKTSDAGTTTTTTTTSKGRSGSTDQGIKHSESSSSVSSITRARGDSIDYNRDARRPSEPITKAETKRSENLLIGSKDYRKLSKSTSDAGRTAPATHATPIASNPRSVSTSGVLTNKTPTKVSRENSRESSRESLKESSKDKQPGTKNQDKTASPSKGAGGVERSKEEKSPLKVIIPASETSGSPEGPQKLKRHRRKKSKQKAKKALEGKRPSSVKQNPAALDFLKGISLGENTPTLRKRRNLGKSKLSEVYPSRNQDVQNKMSDAILFVGSSSTKKIKIADYASQEDPGKLYFSTRSNSTFAVFSIIKYDAKASKKEKEKNSLKDSSISTIGKLKSVSNAPIVINAPKSEVQGAVESEMEYNPYFLDDPSLTTGKHRTVMNLPCFKESIIPYVRPGVIKDELNELFRQKHPWVHSGVTLHKIRKLKKALVLISVAGGLEVSTVAIAYTLFEKLIMKGLVTKPLIRVYGAVCLILAAKSNDPHGDQLKPTLEAIEKQLDVEMKELWEYEFPVFAAFSCSLLLPAEHVIPHIRLIIKDHQDLVGNPY